jgi:precorrin-6Y C5,15-methyltransferase (decarboxylating)
VKDKRRICIVGMPSNFKRGLNVEALEALESCDKIFCSKRFFDVFKKDKTFKTKLVQFSDKLSALPALIASTPVPSPQSPVPAIAVLATGDPDFFGITNFLKKHFPDAIEKIIPAPSIMQEAFALLKMNWDDAGFYSLHGKSREGLLAFLLKHNKGFMFTSNSADMLYILKTLKECRLEDYSVHLFENLGRENCGITEIKFPYLLKKPASDLNALVFTREQAIGSYIGMGLEESRYKAKKGMITKREVRVNALSLLDLNEGNIVWDIGAGSGSLSIEASFNPAGTLVFAIEKDEESFFNLKDNLKKFSAVNVKPIFAEFFDIHKNLPVADRIFIGGGGKDWLKNLHCSFSSLKQGGIMVVSAITLESLTQTTQFLSGKKIPFQISGITAVRGESVKGHNILKSKNPVFLIKAVK